MPVKNAWRVQTIRSTVFNSLPGMLTTKSWKDVADAEPPMVRSDMQAGIRQEAGPLPLQADATLTIVQQFGRADLVINPLVVDAARDIGKDIGNLPTAFKLLSPLFERWISADQPISRLALGVTLIAPTESTAKSIQVLLRHLPALNLKEPLEDLVFQINRPCTSTKIPGLKVNRLTQWQSIFITNVAVTSAMPFFQTTAMGSRVAAAQCVIDINSDAAGRDLPKDKLPVLFAEFKSLMQEIEQNGDMQ